MNRGFRFSAIAVLLLPLAVSLAIVFSIRSNVKTDAIDSKISELSAIAAIQNHRLDGIVDHYLDRVELISSRTNLRKQVVALNGSPANSEEIENEINKILRDILLVDTEIDEIHVTNKNNIVVGCSQPDQDSHGNVSSISSFYDGSTQPTRINEIFKSDKNELKLRLVGPMYLDGEWIGDVEIISRADKLIALTEDFTGLGNTGEVILLERVSVSEAKYITPLRFNQSASLKMQTTTASGSLLATVSDPEPIVVNKEGLIDYRDRDVVSITLTNPATNWAIIAKVDLDEVLTTQLERIDRSIIVLIGINLLALLIWALILARRIHLAKEEEEDLIPEEEKVGAKKIPKEKLK